MGLISSLWLPILLSSVFVFVASSVVHMMLPFHKGDYRKVPGQDDVMEALRKFNIPPGDYMLPRCDTMAEMRSPEFKEKMTKGPVALMTVMPSGQFGMGAQLIQWFIYCIVVGFFAAYLASRVLPVGAPYLIVFRVVGTVAFCCYALGHPQLSIWYRRSWRTTLVYAFDGLVFAGLTAGTFGWLWPK